MRIVVVGATGNVGTSVVDELARRPEVTEVVAVARRAPAVDWPPSVRFVAADVATDDLEPVLAGADAVVHLAWLFQPSHDPLLTWRVNAVGSARVFEAAAAAGVGAVVYSSSVGAYSPAPDRTVDETWPTHSIPTAAYGREKAYVERVLDAFEARHPEIRVVRLRPAFIFKRTAGPEQRRLFAGPLLPRAVLRRGVPVLPLPAGLRFQALHSTDAARAFAVAATGDARGAFNIAAEPVIDAAALASVVGARPVEVPPRALRAALATAWHLRLVPTQPALYDLALGLPLLDTTRAATELGWRPTVSAVDALAEAVAGMAEGAGEDTPPLAADGVRGRAREVATGVGSRP
ncbi:MAG: NAD-dependent epimerase/dehydratase family protein [Thermoanaerobacterales bacterium]